MPEQPEEQLPDEQELEDKRSPVRILLALFILLIFLVGIIPLYSLKLNPSPNMHNVDAGVQFNLSAAQPHPSSIQQATQLVRVEDYRALATQIVTQACSSESEVCYSKALYYYVRDNVQYVSDPEEEYIELPDEVLMTRGADCDGTALLLATLLEAVGIDADVGLTANHAFVRAQVPSLPFWLKANSDYVYLDPTSEFEFGERQFKNEAVVGWEEL